MADNWLENKMDDYRQAKAAGAIKRRAARAVAKAEPKPKPEPTTSPLPEIAGRRVLVEGDDALLRPIVAALTTAGAEVYFKADNQGLARLIAIETGAKPVADTPADAVFDRIVTISQSE